MAAVIEILRRICDNRGWYSEWQGYHPVFMHRPVQRKQATEVARGRRADHLYSHQILPGHFWRGAAAELTIYERRDTDVGKGN